MEYIIEGLVENFSSDGTFTIHGSEGYCLKKDDKDYNVFWENSENGSKGSENAKSDAETLAAFPQKESAALKLPTDGRQWEFQLLVSAKANHQKVRVEVALNGELKSTTVTKVTLL